MSISDICRISFPWLMGLKCAHSTYTRTHHYIEIIWFYLKCQIKCYIKIYNQIHKI